MTQQFYSQPYTPKKGCFYSQEDTPQGGHSSSMHSSPYWEQPRRPPAAGWPHEPRCARMVTQRTAVSPDTHGDPDGSHLRGCQTNKKTDTKVTYYVLAFSGSSRTCKGICGNRRAASFGKVAMTGEGTHRDFTG